MIVGVDSCSIFYNPYICFLAVDTQRKHDVFVFITSNVQFQSKCCFTSYGAPLIITFITNLERNVYIKSKSPELSQYFLVKIF